MYISPNTVVVRTLNYFRVAGRHQWDLHHFGGLLQVSRGLAWLGILSCGLGKRLERHWRQQFSAPVEGRRSLLSAPCSAGDGPQRPGPRAVNPPLHATERTASAGSVPPKSEALPASLGLPLGLFWWGECDCGYPPARGHLRDSGQHRQTTGVTLHPWPCSSEHNGQACL